jgi:hypothetical protein
MKTDTILNIATALILGAGAAIGLVAAFLTT